MDNTIDMIARLAREKLGLPISRLEISAESSSEQESIQKAMESIPIDMKKEYSDACNAAPQIAIIESYPRQFVKTSNDMPAAAATRMAKYWKYRQTLFGGTSHKPLTATGAGAMSASDIEVFDSGFFVELPRDSSSRPTICYDRSRLEKDFDDMNSLLPSMIRCAFYVLSVVVEYEESQSKGVLLIEVNHATFQPKPLDTLFRKELYLLVQEVLPIVLVHSHIIFKFPRTGRREYLKNSYSKATDAIKNILVEGTFTIYGGTPKDQLCTALQQIGFRKEGLPETIGGSWGYFEQFSRWKRERRVVERFIEYAQFDSEKALLLTEEHIHQEDHKRRKRIKDAVYARKRRLNRKLETENLLGQVEALEREKADLLETSKTLHQLFGQASKLLQAQLGVKLKKPVYGDSVQQSLHSTVLDARSTSRGPIPRSDLQPMHETSTAERTIELESSMKMQRVSTGSSSAPLQSQQRVLSLQTTQETGSRHVGNAMKPEGSTLPLHETALPPSSTSYQAQLLPLLFQHQHDPAAALVGESHTTVQEAVLYYLLRQDHLRHQHQLQSLQDDRNLSTLLGIQAALRADELSQAQQQPVMPVPATFDVSNLLAQNLLSSIGQPFPTSQLQQPFPGPPSNALSTGAYQPSPRIERERINTSNRTRESSNNDQDPSRPSEEEDSKPPAK